MVDLRSEFIGIKSPNPFWLASAPPTDKEYNVVRAFEEFAKQPRPGEVYNLGGGRANAASILECIQMIEELGGHNMAWTYEAENRIGDHIWYISDLRKLKAHYPDWSITRSLRDIILELIEAEERRKEGVATRP